MNKNFIYVLLCGTLLTLSSFASEHDVEECSEASDFIHNAAVARDAGMTREFFIGKMLEDIQLIQSYPLEFRWFIRDDDDANYLLERAELVWDSPQQPTIHRNEVLRSCPTIK